MSPETGPISLNLNSPAAPPALPDASATVPVEQLQFRHAETDDAAAVSARRCAVCKLPIQATYYQAAGKDVCPNCTDKLQALQSAPPAHALLQAALYGAGAALAGCVLYAFVAIQFGLELALIAILIGYMVGKAVRIGSKGRGGRPQQIMAVVMTYFAITFSYVAVFVYQAAQKPQTQATTAQATTTQATTTQATTTQAATAQPDPTPKPELGKALVGIVVLAAIAPFLGLMSNPASSALSLLIIFFGLRQAWRMTGRPKIPIFGPYNAAETS